MKKIIFSLYLLFFSTPFFAQVTYVNVNVTGGTGDGSSWENAMPGLASAISQAQYGDTIWVAEGQYLPTPGTNRNFSFVLKDGVRMFGGFKGDETDLSERDWQANETVLSGDIGVPGDSTDNCYSVVFCAFADSTTLIDGFVIEGGNADNPNGSGTSSGRNGGGMYLTGASSAEDTRLQVLNCLFRNNHADISGGGMFSRVSSNGGASPFIESCLFSGNTAQNGGGLAFIGASKINDQKITNCTFHENNASFFGGGVYLMVDYGTEAHQFNQCTFQGNVAQEGGGFSKHGIAFTAITCLDGCSFINNFVVGDQISSGGGILSISYIDFPASSIVNCIFDSNKSEGENSAIGSFMEVENIGNSVFMKNETELGPSIDLNIDTISINNSVFSNNRAIRIATNDEPSTIILREIDSASIINCSFIGNKGASEIGVIRIPLNTQINLSNCIFNKNRGKNVFSFDSFFGDTGYAVFSHSLVDTTDCAVLSSSTLNATCGPGMLYGLDPMFLDTAAGDFRLHPCSPARNAGDNTAALAADLTTDINGLDRIQEGNVDMGAHETPPFSVTLDTIVDVDCAGESTGSFTVGVHSGCGPFALSFNGIASPADTSATITLDGLFATGYEVTVGDSQGRTDTLDLEIASPEAMTADIEHTEVDCSLSMPASASATASGGTGPLDYLWDTGDEGTFTESLGTGQHYLTLTDSLNCSVTDSFWVGFIGELPLGSETENIACFGGANGRAALLPGGLSPHFFQWENGAADSLLEDLGPGQYSATVTDALGCRDSVQLEITQPDSLVLVVSGTDTLCFGAMDGQLAGVPSGGTPGYLFEWENGPADSLFSGLPEGGYSLTVTDANGCTATATAVVHEAGAITAQATVTHATGASVADGSIELTATMGGQPPFTYLWSNGETGTEIDGLTTGGYSLTITDSDSCQQVFDFFVDFGTSAVGESAGGLEIRLAPNPVAAGSGFSLFAKAQNAQAVSLALYGLDGKILWDGRVELPSGESGHLLEAPKLAGAYFLLVENGNGERATLKLMAF